MSASYERMVKDLTSVNQTVVINSLQALFYYNLMENLFHCKN